MGSIPIYHDIADSPVYVGDFLMYQEQYPDSDIVYQLVANHVEDGGWLEIATIGKHNEIAEHFARWAPDPDIPTKKETTYLKLVAI